MRGPSNAQNRVCHFFFLREMSGQVSRFEASSPQWGAKTVPNTLSAPNSKRSFRNTHTAHTTLCKAHTKGENCSTTFTSTCRCHFLVAKSSSQTYETVPLDSHFSFQPTSKRNRIEKEPNRDGLQPNSNLNYIRRSSASQKFSYKAISLPSSSALPSGRTTLGTALSHGERSKRF